mmetsp:Transcript_41052/g.100983  ORF Transcript_41052/g.100983 Transcript_41052/m.100983 type:complete len:203 (+) Transcript_41052:508-1116(+)
MAASASPIRSSGGRLGTNVSKMASVDVTATPCSTRRAMSAATRGESISSSSSDCCTSALGGHTSSGLLGTKSVATSRPCSRHEMPASIASLSVTEHRWPVTLWPRLRAAAMAARSCARVIHWYALKWSAPDALQNSTVRAASAASLSLVICKIGVASPLRYGPATCMCGPTSLPASMSRLSIISVSGSTVPAVRIVVTPRAR